MMSHGFLHMDATGLTDLQGLTYIRSVWKTGCSLEDLPGIMDNRHS